MQDLTPEERETLGNPPGYVGGIEQALEEQELQRLKANRYTARSPKWRDWLTGFILIVVAFVFAWLISQFFPEQKSEPVSLAEAYPAYLTEGGHFDGLRWYECTQIYPTPRDDCPKDHPYRPGDLVVMTDD